MTAAGVTIATWKELSMGRMYVDCRGGCLLACTISHYVSSSRSAPLAAVGSKAPNASSDSYSVMDVFGVMARGASSCVVADDV